MMVLVNTDELSDVAAAEVEAIAHLRAEQAKHKMRTIRRDVQAMTYPASGSASDFRRSDNKQIADGKTTDGPLPHEAQMVPGSQGARVDDGVSDDRGDTGETVPGRASGPRRRR